MSAESTAHLSNHDIKCEFQETEVRRIPVGVLRVTIQRRRINCHKRTREDAKEEGGAVVRRGSAA
ncbi:hypothetical protein CKO51_08680 [Rhodopirellula sp. SM50]|nr:hypothetical protein CKO51_08680 [Rhodopirellula sp. SM50]